ncbi:MAG TPA: hypothetical protein VI670_22880 [Thermoanaerobaculia bacterium]|jgi:hypothetical protein
MNEQSITPMTYLREMVAMSWTHGWELAAAIAGAAAAVIAALVVRSHGPANALFVLLSAMVLLLEAAAAAWRLHRRQGVALTITRSLLDLNAADRVELERHLRTRYRRREARIEERNAARLERLAGEIDALQTEVLGRSHRRVAM